jgi:O-antigen/teichoic acid export membrane protein
MTAFSVVIVLGAESAIQFLYPAPQYGGYGHVVYVLAFATSAAALGMPASNGLATMGKARAAAAITLATALLHCVLVIVAMSGYGLIGAAYATLTSSAVWTTARWMTFLHFAGRHASTSALKR